MEAVFLVACFWTERRLIFINSEKMGKDQVHKVQLSSRWNFCTWNCGDFAFSQLMIWSARVWDLFSWENDLINYPRSLRDKEVSILLRSFIALRIASLVNNIRREVVFPIRSLKKKNCCLETLQQCVKSWLTCYFDAKFPTVESLLYFCVFLLSISSRFCQFFRLLSWIIYVRSALLWKKRSEAYSAKRCFVSKIRMNKICFAVLASFRSAADRQPLLAYF